VAKGAPVEKAQGVRAPVDKSLPVMEKYSGT
jgi:hypothetical protein